MTEVAMLTASMPSQGSVVQCRSHRWLVEKVEPSEHPEGDTVVRMACLDDDANGQRLEVFWEREVDAQVLGETTWDTVGQRGFDQPQVFGSYLNTLRWNCVTSTEEVPVVQLQLDDLHGSGHGLAATLRALWGPWCWAPANDHLACGLQAQGWSSVSRQVRTARSRSFTLVVTTPQTIS
jgi:hypothetical protein